MQNTVEKLLLTLASNFVNIQLFGLSRSWSWSRIKLLIQRLGAALNMMRFCKAVSKKKLYVRKWIIFLNCELLQKRL
jgi:hypothetical protein